MYHSYYLLLEILVVLVFAILMLFLRGNKNRIFIEYVLLAYPFMAMNVFPSFGYPTLFDLTTITFIILFYKSVHNNTFSMGWYLFFVIMLIFSTIIGTFYAQENSNSTIAAMIQYFAVIAFAKLIVDECIFDNKYFFTIISYLRFSVWLSLLFLSVQFLYGPVFTFVKSLNENVFQGDVFRYPSFFQDPQKYAQFLAASFFIALIPTKSAGIYKWLNYLLPVLVLIALLFTGGRAAFIGLLLGLLIVIILGMPQYRVAIITVFIALFLIGYSFKQDLPMFNRSSTYDESYEFRTSVWKDALEIWKQHPYFGIGLGNYANYVAVHNPDQYWISGNEITIFDHPESGYLKFLTEFGIVGCIALFACILLPVYIGFKYFFKTKDMTTLLLIAALVSWLVGFVTVYSFSDVRMSILIAAIIALLIASPVKDVVEEHE